MFLFYSVSLRFVIDAIRLASTKYMILKLRDPDPNQPSPKIMSDDVGSIKAFGGSSDGRSVDQAARRRIQARVSMLDEVGKRNDIPFFASLAAALILPGIFGLIIAYFSGYNFGQ
mmetsp:Transcript_2484/g.3613  ORF Transcript_2484/g.3613 Transcript_2484/m.3613 type:complete len:115 (+) Transcript_2484:582-926(+)